MNADLYFNSVTAIAKACGVERHAVTRWLNDPTFPAKGKRGWPKLAVMEWAGPHLSRHARSVTGQHADIKREKILRQIEKLLEDIRRARAEANMAEKEDAKLAGMLVSAAEVNSAWARVSLAVRNDLMALPTALAPRLVSIRDPSEAEKIVEEALRDCVRHIAEKNAPGV